MSSNASWKNLGIGVLSLGAVVAGAASILVFGRIGNMRGDTLTLYVATNAARGITRGSEVWLDGQRVGTVKNVVFQPPATGASERLTLVVRILEKARLHVRRDSRVQISSGGSLLGSPVVQVSSGTMRQPAVREGDTLRAINQPDAESMASDLALASREFPAIIANVKVLADQIESVHGTIGALTGGDDQTARRVRATIGRLAGRVSNPASGLGAVLRSRDSLRARIRATLAQVDSMRTLLSSNHHSLGRFRRDSTIAIQLAQIRAEVADVRRRVGEPGGAIGRFRTDAAIVAGLDRGLRSVDSLIADFKKHPLRYIAF